MEYEKLTVTETTPITGKDRPKAAHHEGGLSVAGAVFFLIAELIGVGALALPNSLARSGYIGVFSLCCACALAIYNGSLLGTCWTVLLDRYPEYRTHCRYPYAAIGEKSCGKWMKYVVSVCMAFTCLGSCVLYFLMASEVIHVLVSLAHVNISFCAWMPVFAAVLIPLSWFGSPKDFTWIAVVAVVTATTALIMISGKILYQLPPPRSVRHQFPTNPRLYFLSFGVALYAFNGACTFPTIQHDMKDPHRFTLALAISYIYGLFIYVPVAVIGYYAYGETVSANLLMTMEDSPVKIVAMVLYIFHIIGAYLVFFNPPVQGIEETLHIPNIKCNCRRLLFRTALVCVILFIAETVPHFGAILALIGGSSSGFLTFIAPPVFFLCLCKNGYTDTNGQIKTIPMPMKALSICVICIGILASSTSTYAAISQLTSPSTFVPPCYVNATAAAG